MSVRPRAARGGCRRRAAGQPVLLAAVVLTLLPAAAPAQSAPPRPLARITPSLAWALGGIGAGVTSTGVRIEVPALARLTPWVSRSEFELGIDCIPENPVCLSDGTAWLAGVLLDGGSRESRLRPYLGAGIGWWRNEAGTGFANGVLFGVAVELIPLLAPVAELRWERYPVLGRQSLASLGLQLTLPRPGGDSGR